MKQSVSREKPDNRRSVSTERTVSTGSGGVGVRRNPFVRNEDRRAMKRRVSPIREAMMRNENKAPTIIPRLPFQRLVRELCQEQFEEKYRWTSLSLEALQTSAEDYVVRLMEDSHLCTLHGNRVTLLLKDLHLARRIRGCGDPGNR